MSKISAPIKTCISAASIMVKLGEKAQAEALYRAAYDAARRGCPKSDLGFALKALLNFCQRENGIDEAVVIGGLTPKQKAKLHERIGTCRDSSLESSDDKLAA